jgi:hypothetical protein
MGERINRQEDENCSGPQKLDSKLREKYTPERGPENGNKTKIYGRVQSPSDIGNTDRAEKFSASQSRIWDQRFGVIQVETRIHRTITDGVPTRRCPTGRS